MAVTLAGWMIITAAAPYDDAARLYQNGKYLESASLATRGNTAPSYALAARAYLAYAIYEADPAQRAVEVQKGAALASKALTLDPNLVEAHLQLVVALYQKARESTPIGAYFRGYAEAARSHLDTALSLEPKNPWVHSALGAWHFEVVRLAGAMLAENLYGASLTKGRTAFAKAIALKPGNIVMQFNFARALLLSDTDTNRAEAIRALQTAMAATPVNHLDKIMAARAGAVLAAVNSASPEALHRVLNTNGF